MKKRKKGRCFTISAVRQALEPRAIEMEPEELAVYVRRAEQEVLPIIKKMYLGREAAQFLLAQQAQVLVTGDPHLPPRVGWPSPIASWRSGWRDIARTSVSLHTRRDAAGATGRPKRRRTTRHISSHSLVRTERDHAASAKWPGGSSNIPRRSCGRSG
jgi:hypothetical protein